MDDFKNLDSNLAKVKERIKRLVMILGIVGAAIISLVILVIVALFIYLTIAARHGPLLLP